MLSAISNSNSASLPSGDWDVVVIGAGPAGAVVARELALNRLRVLLVDRKRFPRRKVCGGCLNQRALAVLHETDLLRSVNELRGVTLDRFALYAAGSIAQFDLPAGLAVSRASLDAALTEQARLAGATFCCGMHATVLRLETGHRMVQLVPDAGPTESNGARVEGQTLAAKVVVVADGLGHSSLGHLPRFHDQSSIRARLGAACEIAAIPPGFRPGTLHMAVGQFGYVGLTQIETGDWNIAAAFDPEFVKLQRGLGNAAAAVLSESGCGSVPHLGDADWLGTPLLTRHLKYVSDDRLFVVGDAAGYIEPFTGEGMAWALESALALAPLVHRACDNWHQELADEWSRRHHRTVRRRTRLCLAVAMAARRPWVYGPMVRTLARWPALARPIVKCLNRTKKSSERIR